MDELTFDDLTFAFDLEPKEAIKYFKSLGIEPASGWEDVLKAIENDAFAISGVKNMDHLMDARDMIEQALEGEITLEDFKNKFNEEMQLRSWHADLVISQNISNAMNAGRYGQQMGNIDLIPYIRPVITDDDKTTDICLNLKKLNIALRKSDSGLKTQYAPKHFHCRTIWVGCTQGDIQRLGLNLVGTSSLPDNTQNAKGFDRLPTDPLKFDLSGYPGELIKQFKKLK